MHWMFSRPSPPPPPSHCLLACDGLFRDSNTRNPYVIFILFFFHGYTTYPLNKQLPAGLMAQFSEHSIGIAAAKCF